MNDLQRVLESLGIRTAEASSLGDMRRALHSRQAPRLIFTDLRIPGGDWRDVVDLAATAPAPPSVIVTPGAMDLQVYLEALDHGALDFLPPPFLPREVEFIVEGARRGVSLGRKPAQRVAAAELPERSETVPARS
jgi:DNA-binding NtrC family response regulator